jgi:hypothetical protein
MRQDYERPWRTSHRNVGHHYDHWRGVFYPEDLPKTLYRSYPKSSDDIEPLKREAGVTAVLNLQTDDDMRYFKLAWDTLLHHYESCGVELHRVSVRDFDAMDLGGGSPLAYLRSMISSNQAIRSISIVLLVLAGHPRWRSPNSVGAVVGP